MTRFQLVFRDDDGDVTEFRDSSDAGEPHINGVVLIDGNIFARGGSDWVASREDHTVDGMIRFVCVRVAPAVGVE